MVEQVQIPHSVVAGKAPLPAEVIVGGLALNLKDYTLYSKGYDGVVFKLTGVVAVKDDTDTNAVVYPTWVKATDGSALQYTSSSKLSFNPSTGRLSATSFAGNGADLTDFTAGQIVDALGYRPVEPEGTPLAPPATDLATVIDLANSIRAVLIGCGIGS
jgi:hypothetical protein